MADGDTRMTRAELIERLEKARGEDRELDGLIFGWLHKTEPCGTFMCGFDEEKFQFRHPDDAPTGRFRAWYVRGENVPAYTASIDAVVALVERELPGWGYYLRSDKEGNGCGLVYPDAFRVTPCHCMGATPAIAVCLALLRALEAQEDNHG
jgi:hypothetical protein